MQYAKYFSKSLIIGCFLLSGVNSNVFCSEQDIIAPSEKATKHVALLIMATGRYVAYAERLVRSAEKFFCTDCKKTYVIFTDAQRSEPTVSVGNNTVLYIAQQRLGWPHDTLMRTSVYLKNFKQYDSGVDYMFAVDADMLFVAPVGHEIFSDRVVVKHPGFLPGDRGSYETNPISAAFVRRHEGTTYFAGGFYGGSHDEFFKTLVGMNKQIERDLAKNFIAVWHDESHLNRWFIYHPPTLILEPGYCYPEYVPTIEKRVWDYLKNFTPRLMALSKNHKEMRQ